MGNYEEAIEDFNKSIEQNANNGMAYYRRGQAYLKLDNQQFAISDFKKARQFCPNNDKIKEDYEKLKQELDDLLKEEKIYY